MSQYEAAKEAYAKFGIDTDKAIDTLSKVRISMHCWQGDDVLGFDSKELTGGIATTGNYPGRARNPEELMADIHKAFSLIPGKHKLNLHASYLISDKKVDRNEIEPEHFKAWVDFARKEGIGLDFNPTLFSHKMASENFTLASPKKEVRDFWIEHCRRSRKIAAYFGKELGMPCLNNIWIPDGLKDVPADRLGPRMRLKESLDTIYQDKYDRKYLADSVEGKVFGLGVESYTVGSHEFYYNYALKNNLLCLLDTGHYHPTEVVSDKISSFLPFFEQIALHVSRPVRWDSDHVIKLDDELREVAKEVVAANALKRVFIALDFFDASINRVAAWVIGMRNMQKALLVALLTPHAHMKELQDSMNYTELLALTEDLKLLPFGDVFNEFCKRQGVPGGMDWFADVKRYEQDVQLKRA